ncbi:MAG: OmpA family protein [Ignavibacteria bacterium]|nr:OmpA family protein [Ignavibacteria bacterium]
MLKSLVFPCIIFLFPIILNINLESKPKVGIEGLFLPTFNFYFADFSGFKGYNCCGNFSKGGGFGYNIALGTTLKPIFREFQTDFGIYSNFSLQNYSGKFDYNEYFADVIIDEKVYKAISRHLLKINLPAAVFATGLSFSNIWMLKDLELRLGLDLSVPLTSKFQQSETLVEPERAYFENGEKTRNTFSGKIPDLKPNLALNLSIAYTFFKSSNFSISPRFSFAIPFFNQVKDINWKIYSIGLGLSLAYTLPKIEPPPPIAPPLLDLPELQPPKLPPKLEAKLNLKINNDNVLTSDTIAFYTTRIKFIRKEFLPAIFFFPHNEYTIYKTPAVSDMENRRIYELNYSTIIALKDFFAKNPNIKLSVICSQNDSEEANICEHRISQTIGLLKTFGINVDNIEKQTLVVKAKTQPPELSEETRSVRILFPNGNFIFEKQELSNDSSYSILPKIKVETVVEPNNPKVSIVGKIGFNSSIVHFKDREFQFDPKDFTSNPNGTLQIEVIVKSEDELEQSVKLEKNLTFEENVKDSLVLINPYQIKGSQAILVSLFNFDEDNFYWINSEVEKIINQAKKTGKEIFIIGSVDNVGTEAYNKQLAIRRANRIKNYLGIDAKIESFDNGGTLFSNETPIGRMMNRSAWLLVK